MSSPFNTRLKQFLCAVQSVAGAFETLDSSHGRLRLNEGSDFNYDPEQIERTRLRDSMTPLPRLVGTKAQGFTLKSEMNTPDTITSALEEAPLLRAAGFVPAVARLIGVGSFTGGTPARNATVTGVTSGAVARLLVPPAWTPSALLLAVTSGTFQSGETLNISGGITCVSSSVANPAGWWARPSTPTAVLSGRLEVDGQIHTGRDLAVTFAFEIENSGLGMWTWTLLGARVENDEDSMTSGIAFDIENPPQFQDADLVIGSTFKPVLAKVAFELGGKLVKRGDANAAGDTGLAGGRFDDRKPMLKVTIETPNQGDFNFYSAFDDSQTYPVRLRLGQDLGKSIGVFADYWQPGTPTPSENEHIGQFEIDGLCTSPTANTECEFVWF